jgi:hypothetical protein
MPLEFGAYLVSKVSKQSTSVVLYLTLSFSTVFLQWSFISNHLASIGRIRNGIAIDLIHTKPENHRVSKKETVIFSHISLSSRSTLECVLACLKHFNFHGNTVLYYSAENRLLQFVTHHYHHPISFVISLSFSHFFFQNSILDRVIATRQGIPITLCVLAHAIARRCGIELKPVGFPTHFLLSLQLSGDERLFLDCFWLKIYDMDDCKVLLSQNTGDSMVFSEDHLVPIDTMSVIRRMFNNLRLQQDDSTQELMVALGHPLSHARFSRFNDAKEERMRELLTAAQQETTQTALAMVNE